MMRNLAFIIVITGLSSTMSGNPDGTIFYSHSQSSMHYNKPNKNLAIANRSHVSCAHNTLRASIGLNIAP